MAHAANTTNDPRLPVLPPAVGAKLSPATYTPMHGCVLQAMLSNTVRYPSSPPPSGTAAAVRHRRRRRQAVVYGDYVRLHFHRNTPFCHRKIPFRTRIPHLCGYPFLSLTKFRQIYNVWQRKDPHKRRRNCS